MLRCKFLYMCMFVYLYLKIYIYIYTYIIHVYIDIYILTYIYESIYIAVYFCMYLYTYIYIHIFIYAYTQRGNEAFHMRKENEEHVMLRKMYRSLLNKMHEWGSDEQNDLRQKVTGMYFYI
jgi:hypothetical protein